MPRHAPRDRLRDGCARHRAPRRRATKVGDDRPPLGVPHRRVRDEVRGGEQDPHPVAVVQELVRGHVVEGAHRHADGLDHGHVVPGLGQSSGEGEERLEVAPRGRRSGGEVAEEGGSRRDAAAAAMSSTVTASNPRSMNRSRLDGTEPLLGRDARAPASARDRDGPTGLLSRSSLASPRGAYLDADGPRNSGGIAATRGRGQ